jgi:phosphoglycerate dehydrogenase-like enzyme
VERALTPAARERGIVITNARGVFSRPIAEYVLMMILAISRRLPGLLELQRERTWQPLEGVELRELTIGVIGYGSIGRAVASLAGAFGARVIALRRNVDAGGAGAGPGTGASAAAAAAGHGGLGSTGPGMPGLSAGDDDFPFAPAPARIVGPEALHELLAASDIVVLAAPLTPETDHMIDSQALDAMKPTGWLINVARGRLVDERALVAALNDGRIGGAVLDTFTEEPLAPTSPFYDLPNVIVTPHTAWSSARVLDRSIDLFCDNLVRFSRGERLRNVVDPTAGY